MLANITMVKDIVALKVDVVQINGLLYSRDLLRRIKRATRSIARRTFARRGVLACPPAGNGKDDDRDDERRAKQQQLVKDASRAVR